MAPTKQKVEKVLHTILRLDKSKNPWGVVEEELPTKMKFIFSRKKQGTILDSNSGVTNMGSMQFSGSNYDAYPGTYSFRVTGRNVAAGSMGPNTDAWWYLHHSRLGTVDAMPIKQAGTQSIQYGIPQVREANGGPLNPLYSFPPGTLTQYVRSYKGTLRISASLRGFTG